MGEFGLGSLPDGTLHSPHHKTISRGLTELPAPPIPLSEAQKRPYDRSSPPNLLFALICEQETCWQMGLAREKGKEKKKEEEMRGKKKASKGEHGGEEIGVDLEGCDIAEPSAPKLAPLKGRDTYARVSSAPKTSWFCPIFRQQLCTSAVGFLHSVLPVPSCCSYSAGRCSQVAQPPQVAAISPRQRGLMALRSA